MVSERYFLFGIEEMGIALDSLMKDTPISTELINNILSSIKSGKIPKEKLLEFISNIINDNIINVLIEDKELGDHLKKQFLNKVGKKIVIETDFFDPVKVEIVENSKLVKISLAPSNLDPKVPTIRISEALLRDILEKNDYRLLKYLTLNEDDQRVLQFSETDREYIADMIVRIFLAVSTAILMRDNLRNQIKNNIIQSIKLASSLFS
ncbi:MAG: hypothetical protein GF329_20360 [Candidatus Lokiarchaeota archaeon]|nr:hypothetical protein [Candidatus Lokiarchaeota archaeon]